MKKLRRAALLSYFLAGVLVLMMVASAHAAPKSIYDFTLPLLNGKDAPLANYKGKVVLVVNVASRCGFTPQYTALESIYEKYKDQGFVIIGFPANNFGGQEPGTNEEIAKFCTGKYNVTFPGVRKNLREGRRSGAALQLPHQGSEPPRGRRHQVELHEVSGGSQRKRGAAVRIGRHAGFARSDRGDRSAAEEVTESRGTARHSFTRPVGEAMVFSGGFLFLAPFRIPHTPRIVRSGFCLPSVF